MTEKIIAYSILALILILFLLPNIIIVKDDQAIVIERLGMFLKVVDIPGVIFLIPLVDRVIQKESKLAKVHHYVNTSEGIKKELSMKYQIVDIKMFCYRAAESHRFVQEIIFDAFTSFDYDAEKLEETLLNHGVKLVSVNEINF